MAKGKGDSPEVRRLKAKIARLEASNGSMARALRAIADRADSWLETIQTEVATLEEATPDTDAALAEWNGRTATGGTRRTRR